MKEEKRYIYNLKEEQKDFIKDKSIEEFKKIMVKRGIKLKEKQLEFIEDLIENILTNNKDKIYVNSNRAGMGKSTIIAILLHYLVINYLWINTDDNIRKSLIEFNDKPYKINEDGKRYNYCFAGFGAVYITDNLERLNSFYHNSLIFDLCGLVNSEILQATSQEDGTNTKWNNLMTKYYYKPIIAMTTQKYALLTDEEKTKLFKWNLGERKLLIFDEKPSDLIMKATTINQQYISDCITAIAKEIEEDAQKNKSFLKDYMYKLEAMINEENDTLFNNYNLTYAKKRKYPILINERDDKKFFKILKEKASADLYKKINNIRLAYNNGFIFEKSNNSNPEDKDNKFIILENNVNNSFSADKYNVILDATSYSDTDYIINSRFIVNNSKDSKENSDIKFRIFDIPTSKTSLFNPKYREKFLDWFKKLADKDMFITFNKWLFDYIYKFDNIDRNNIEWFGNIKGKNNWNKLNKYCQVGFLRKSDSYYVCKYLLIYNKIDELNNMEQNEIDEYISNLIEKDKYGRFKNTELEDIFLSDLIVDTNQNLMRIKCRDYSNTDICTVNLIYAKNAYDGFLKGLLDSLGIDYDKAKEQGLINEYPRPSIFIEEHKTPSERKNLIKGYNEFISWFSNWNGEKVLISDIKEICNIDTKKQWTNLKNHKDIKKYFNNIQMIRDNKKYYLSKK